MRYLVTTKPTFMTDILDFSKQAQKQLSQMQKVLEEHAEQEKGNTIKKLKGYKYLWRYRIADYRIIYAVRENIVIILGAGARRNIYERFSYNPDMPDEVASMKIEATLFPDSKIAQNYQNQQEWEQYSVEQHKREQEKKRLEHEARERLPFALTSERLKQWNIPEKYHPAFTSCVTETELLDATAPPEIVGRVMNIVLSKDALAIAEEPTYIVPSGKKLIEYVEGKISQFLLKLDDKQMELVDWALEGPTMIKGGPGSGKSTVAMYRVKSLIERAIQQGNPSPKILFTTYTHALANVSKELLSQLLLDYDVEVEIKVPDSIAMKYARKNLGNLNIKGDDIWDEAIRVVRPNFAPDRGSALQNAMLLRSIENIPNTYISEEFAILIDGRGVETLNEYLNTERAGRGFGLNERQREMIWKLYENCANWIQEHGRCTWGMVRRLALTEIRETEPEYDYVIIDEAQDLTPLMLKLCVALAKDKRNIFLAADMSQSIYNRRFSYSKVDDNLDVSRRTRLLKRNYRTTAEIVRGAVEIMRGEGVGDQETLIQQCVKYGPKPILYLNDDQEAQLHYVVRFIREQSRQLNLPTGAAAILCSTNRIAENVARQLAKIGLPAKYMTRKDVKLETPVAKVITIHTAKGLEFPIVAMPMIQASTLPGKRSFEDSEKGIEYENSQRRLFFVGATRSMNRLIVTGNLTNDKSPFIEDLSKRGWHIIIEEV